jgi:hypothetical protein
MNGSGLRPVISQPAAVLYIQLPIFETIVASHSAAKLGYWNGPRREGAGAGDAARVLSSRVMGVLLSVVTSARDRLALKQ